MSSLELLAPGIDLSGSATRRADGRLEGEFFAVHCGCTENLGENICGRFLLILELHRVLRKIQPDFMAES